MKATFVLSFMVITIVYGGVLPYSATTLVRTPNLDSAYIKSDRLGGNFAYKTVEGHAYAAVSPFIQHVPDPFSENYIPHQGPFGYAAAPIDAYQPFIPSLSYQHYQPLLSNQILASPVLSPPLLAPAPILAQAPIVVQSPVAVEGATNAPEKPADPTPDPPAPAPVPNPTPAPAAPAPAPVPVSSPPQDTVVDDDTVSVESA